MLCKIRFGYGNQTHEEKMDILHNWYSDLRAYLPVHYQKRMDEYNKNKVAFDSENNSVTLKELVEDAGDRMEMVEKKYDPAFEDIRKCSQDEKDFRQLIRQLKEVLDEITAISKVIDDQQTTSDEGVAVA